MICPSTPTTTEIQRYALANAEFCRALDDPVAGVWFFWLGVKTVPLPSRLLIRLCAKEGILRAKTLETSVAWRE